MNLKVISCLIVTIKLASASFVIQKTPSESRKSKSAALQNHRSGISALSNPSYAASYKMYSGVSESDRSRKSARKSKNKSGRKSGHKKAASSRGSVNIIGKNLYKNGRKNGNKNGHKSISKSHASSSASVKYGRPKSAVISKSAAGRASGSNKYNGANSYTFSQSHSSPNDNKKILQLLQLNEQQQSKQSSRGVTPIKPSKQSPITVSSPSSARKTKSAQNVTIDDFVYVTLPLNQWTQFYFSEVGQLPFSRWTFDIPADQKCTLQVVDAYCTGDRFEAVRRLDSGVEVPLLSTPPVPFNPVVAEQIRLGSNVNCTPFTTDAATAWASSSWSKGEVALTQPGNYKLILKSLLAPYGSGGAYVRINCTGSSPTPVPSNVCSYGSSNIKYIRQTLPFTQQAAVCQSYGLRPLDVTQANIADARAVLLNCAGSGTRAWIASYNGDNYRQTVGLSLHASQLSEVGAITATPDSSPLEGVLCQ